MQLKKCHEEHSKPHNYKDIVSSELAAKEEQNQELLSNNGESRPKRIKRWMLEKKNEKEEPRVSGTAPGIQAGFL